MCRVNVRPMTNTIAMGVSYTVNEKNFLIVYRDEGIILPLDDRRLSKVQQGRIIEVEQGRLVSEVSKRSLEFFFVFC